MTNLLILSCDIIREDDPCVSLSVGSLIAYLKRQPEYLQSYDIHHASINLKKKKIETSIEDLLKQSDISVNADSYDFIAIGVYIWAEKYIVPLIRHLKNMGCKGKIILGGPQIRNNINLAEHYPLADYFIVGYAEECLYKIINYQTEAASTTLYGRLKQEYLTPLYSSGIIPICDSQGKVRMETCRGCRFKCNYCAHRDVENNTVCYKPIKYIEDDLRFLNEHHARKINIIDPVFNEQPKHYIPILEMVIEIKPKSHIALQARLENLDTKEGEIFLNLCSQLDTSLEFGLQTINPIELAAIDRKGNLRHIEKAFGILSRYNIPFSVSIMYGLPNQTFDSFKRTIDFLHKNGCTNIEANPLLLLPGTILYEKQHEYGMHEDVSEANEYGIPPAYSCSKDEWLRMHELAKTL